MDVIEQSEYAMAEQCFNNDTTTTTITPKFNPPLDSSTPPDVDNKNGCFECSICFDSASDPIVTLCGHLYCWACIFKWLRVQTSSDPTRQQACPVCKSGISQASLIPLYCHTPSNSPSQCPNPNPNFDFIPPRPSVRGIHTLHSNQRLLIGPSNFQPQSSAFHHYQYVPASFSNYTMISSSNLVSTTVTGIINPTIGFLGELVYTRMFGSSDSTSFGYPIPSSYAIVDYNNPGLRRQAVRQDESLNRIWIFLLCCCIICWLLF